MSQPATRTKQAEVSHHDSGGGSAQFRNKGGDNSIQNSGREAPATEREEAAGSLHGYLDAAARGDWQRACFYVARSLKRSVVREMGNASLSARGCPVVLAAIFAGVPAKNFADAAKADVGSLRLQKQGGYLLYHGSHHTDYAMPMAIEHGRWKVAALAGGALY